MYGTTTKTWDEAESDCHTWGGHLTTVASAEENTQIKEAIKSRYDVTSSVSAPCSSLFLNCPAALQQLSRVLLL